MPIRRHRRHYDEVGFQIAPMIDITFILLIFFMVTTKLSNEVKSVPVELPVAKSAVIPKDASGRDIVSLDEKGQIYAGDKLVTLKELKIHLQRRLREVPPLKIYVRADEQASGKQIKQIMKTCAEAGAIEVVFGTYQRE